MDRWTDFKDFCEENGLRMDSDCTEIRWEMWQKLYPVDGGGEPEPVPHPARLKVVELYTSNPRNPAATLRDLASLMEADQLGKVREFAVVIDSAFIDIYGGSDRSVLALLQVAQQQLCNRILAQKFEDAQNDV